MPGEQKTLSDFKRENYTLPPIANGNSFKNEDKIDIGSKSKQNFSVACGECGALMRRMGAMNSGWNDDNKMDGSPDLLDLFSCKACHAGSVRVGYFTDKNEIKMSESGTNGSGHKFVKYDVASVENIVENEEDEDDDQYVLVSGSNRLDINRWKEP